MILSATSFLLGIAPNGTRRMQLVSGKFSEVPENTTEIVVDFHYWISPGIALRICEMSEDEARLFACVNAAASPDGKFVVPRSRKQDFRVWNYADYCTLCNYLQ